MPVRRAEAAARDARLRRLRTHAIALDHPDRRLVEAVERAKACLIEAKPLAPAGTLAALVAGEWELAIGGIARLLEQPQTGPATLLTAGLISQLYAWSGDALRARPLLTPGLHALARAGDDADRRIVARELLALAEAAGHPDAARQLRGMAGGAAPGRGVGGVLLGWLAALEPARPASHAGASDSPRRMAEAFAVGRTDEAVEAWTARALAAAEGDATLLPLLAVGLLGLDPDAERGRVRSRLHVPACWPRWSATGIRTGESYLDIRVCRDDRRVEISAEQTDGPLPLTLILEPTVHAPIRAACVDGRPAELAFRAYANRVIAPVQLVLDRDRTLLLELDA